MKLLDLYVARRFLGTFIVLVLGIPLLFIIADITDNIDRYINRGLTAKQVSLSYVYQLPLFIQYSFPIAALVATVFTIGAMTRYQEITAAKAGGLSFYRLMSPIVGMAVLLTVAGLGLGELVPYTLEKRAELMGNRKADAIGSRAAFVYQTQGEGMLTVRMLNVRDREMTGVVLERNASKTGPGMHRIASTARWTPHRGWMLQGGYVRRLGADGTEVTFAFDSLRVPGLTETPDDLLAEPKDAEEMGYEEMSRFITAIDRSGGDSRPLRVERAQKIALPVAVLIIVLFGAPLATSSQRGGTAFGIGISLGVTILYMLLFRVGKAVGSSGALDPNVAAWAPNLLFLVAALWFMSRVRT